MTQAVLRSLRVTHRFLASAERVFDAWLDPATAGRWLFATESSEMVKVEIDARVGGHFCFTDRRDGVDVEHVGEYLEIDRPRRLVFTFAVPRYSTAQTRVSIDIAPLGTGCELVLTHEEVLPEWAEATQRGWGEILGHLDEYLQQRPPRQQPEPDTVRFVRLLPGPVERVWTYLTESDLRAQWLAGGIMPPAPGDEFSLYFHHIGLSRTPVPPPERFQAFADGVTTRHRLITAEPPHRLHYTWGDPAQPSEVSFELTTQGEQVCLVVTHRQLQPGDIAGASGGWHAHLEVLADRLAGRMPQPFWPMASRHIAHYEQVSPS